MMQVLLFVIGAVLGGVSVGAFSRDIHKHKRVGKLRMDNSTGEPYLFMEIEKPVEYILGQDEILLKVDLTPITRE